MLASRREEPSHLSFLFWCCRSSGGLQRRACPCSRHSRKSGGVRPWLVCDADGRGGRCERFRRGRGSRLTGCRIRSGTASCGVVWMGSSGGNVFIGGGVLGVGFPVGAVTTPPGRLMGRGEILAGAACSGGMPVSCRRDRRHYFFVTIFLCHCCGARPDPWSKHVVCGLFTSCTVPTVGGRECSAGRAPTTGPCGVCGGLWAKAATLCKDL